MRFLSLLKGKKLASNSVLNAVELMVLLLVLWFIFSGIFELKFIIFGLLSVLVVMRISMRSLYLRGRHSMKYYFVLNVNIFSFIIYFLWLLKEIIKSSLSVTWNVFRGADSLNPHIVWFRADYDNPSARALLANSITLTPGTVTVDIQPNGVYSVHALTDSCAEGLLDGTMQRKVAHVFREEIDYMPMEAVIVPEKKKEVHLKSKTYSRKGTMHRL